MKVALLALAALFGPLPAEGRVGRPHRLRQLGNNNKKKNKNKNKNKGWSPEVVTGDDQGNGWGFGNAGKEIVAAGSDELGNQGNGNGWGFGNLGKGQGKGKGDEEEVEEESAAHDTTEVSMVISVHKMCTTIYRAQLTSCCSLCAAHFPSHAHSDRRAHRGPRGRIRAARRAFHVHAAGRLVDGGHRRRRRGDGGGDHDLDCG